MALAPSHVSCVTWEGPLNSTESQAQMGGADTNFLGEWLRTIWNKVYEVPDAAPGTQKWWINVSSTSIHTEAKWEKQESHKTCGIKAPLTGYESNG